MSLHSFLILLHAAISHQVDPEFCGLGLGSVLLNSLKQTVVTLASSAGVLSTVQSAAQAMLQSGLSVLLPSAEERARALSAPLPCAVSGNDVNISRGCQFMSDLLVGSLVAAGGLESALHAAITAEIQGKHLEWNLLGPGVSSCSWFPKVALPFTLEPVCVRILASCPHRAAGCCVCGADHMGVCESQEQG
ncbi:E3 ubiquitin-protein ligase HERC2 isoform X2 [Papio anubis]|uniref:E3 ubiquitin-protein ligase HERC2 isoform X2 n=1 Tax=Papio anubis TaxID=9555 RepID=UPI0012AE0805|nr:E3 ubiquitin-protein ligase HERC2 isoform X2 [Papio anubis]